MQEIEIENICEDLIVHSYNECNIRIFENGDTKYNIFFKDIILKNCPCIIKNVSLAWECTESWIKNDIINFDYFIQKYGYLEAPVTDCDSITMNSQCKNKMKVIDYMHYLKNSNREKVLYLKDWHLRKLQPKENFYEVPLIFNSDWLNEFAVDRNEDDFMFVYIGPKHSWTPLHADVYCSFSWSVNIAGRKKWILFPPGEEEKLKDHLGNLPLIFYPEKSKDVKYFEVVQEKGDAIFVPSGWHHQVINILDTISINHNWINGCNVEAVWTALCKSLLSVEREIEEFKDTPEFTSQCQLILKSLFGMDFHSFIDFLNYIGKKRVTQFQKGDRKIFDNVTLGINHIIFDLNKILKIMNFIQNHPLFLNIFFLTDDIRSDFFDTKNEISKLLDKQC